ncbi:transglycosylase domain-containing protein [Phenylobacterium sp.]|jgi:1A family penicillin-binding protein|uniref:transglycosylase domain-containing protein n=1 Tax=Phenylobacterium sp. TaxID=1871053 RepID=UPI002F959B65
MRDYPEGRLEYVAAPAGVGAAPPPAEPPPPEARVSVWRRRPVQIALAAAAALVLLFLWLSWALPVGRALEPLESPTLVLVTADGKPFARRGSYKEAPVEVERLPEHVAGAFIAIEDRRFYRHFGLDFRSIARAAVTNAEEGEVRQGGSTITQQLAKNAFLTNRQTLRRKAQEALIALYLEARLSKEEILSRYLSSVYFGDGVFGLRAAARHYFNKAAEQLTAGEAAMLAGVVKAPSRLAPTEDFQAAQRRQRVVLAAMVEQGMLTPQQARQARRVRLREGRAVLPVGSYFADWISADTKRVFDRAYGEVRVQTTLDSVLQAQAQRAIRRAVGSARGQRATQAALVAMRTDGRVVAMVGGLDYQKSQFNRATQAQRQPGSAFKLFVYLAALRRGYTPDSAILDAPLRLGDWTPQNHEGEYAGRPVPLRDAFARSSNVAAVRLSEQVGRQNVISAARDLGVRSDIPNDPTIALGTSQMSLLELTSAYAAVAAGQAPVRPRGLLVEPAYGPFGGPPRPRALNRRERDGLLVLLRDVVTRGTGAGANLGVPVYGKTGTSQDYRDAWFIGFTGDLVVGVWVGNDDNTPMNRVTGGSIPARVFREFTSFAASRQDFRQPAAVADEAETLDLEAIAPEPLELPPFEGAPTDEAPLDLPPGAEAPPPVAVRPDELAVPPPEVDEPAPDDEPAEAPTP